MSSLADMEPPARVIISSADKLVVGQQMTINIVLEALENLSGVRFNLVIPDQGWQFIGGQASWAGSLKAGVPVQLDVYMIPLVQNPEPIKGRLSVAGWGDTEWIYEGETKHRSRFPEHPEQYIPMPLPDKSKRPPKQGVEKPETPESHTEDNGK